MRKLKSLDHDPEIAQTAKRQLFLNKWYRPTALAPFVIVIVISFKFFPDSNPPIIVALGFVSALWAFGVAAYAFRLLWRFDCPNCGERFGLGEKCRSCRLPRHAPATGLTGDTLRLDDDQSGE
jgi:hypothetical protein